MKELFPGFYSPNLMELKDFREDNRFIFDTNVLLNLFRYPDKTRELLLQILKGISKKIWLPYQVAMEYHQNVVEEIISQNKAYDSLISSLNDKYKKMEEDFQKYAQRHSNLQMDEDLLGRVKNALDTLVQDLEVQKSKHPDLYSLQEDISSIIENIGSSYSQEELDELYKEGEKRYELRIPPGFKDINKGDETRTHNSIVYQNKYGDYILWNQVLDFHKKEDKKSVVFVTDDTKGDWWKNYKGIKKPHPELIQEFMAKCNGSQIFIYTTKQFLKNASELTGIKLDDQEVDEAIQGIDDYKKKKEIIELQENQETIKVQLDKQETLKHFPELQNLGDDEWSLFSEMVLKSDNEEEVVRAIEWAQSMVKSKYRKSTRRRKSIADNNGLKSESFLHNKSDTQKYDFDKVTEYKISENDDYETTMRRIREYHSRVQLKLSLLPEEERLNIIEQIVQLEKIKDIDTSLKLWRNLDNLVDWKIEQL